MRFLCGLYDMERQLKTQTVFSLWKRPRFWYEIRDQTVGESTGRTTLGSC